MLQGAMIKIKAVYIDINPYFRHLGGSFGPVAVKDGETKKMPNTLFGGASVNSARGYIYKIRYFDQIVKWPVVEICLQFYLMNMA